MKKYYCYIDETGQDTKGRFFLVSLLISEKTGLDGLRDTILKLEVETKGKSKWTNTDNRNKAEFMKGIISIKPLRDAVYYSVYRDSTAYTTLVAITAGKAIISETKKYRDDYRVNIIIDGLRKSDQGIIREELKGLNIHYNKIRVGLRDEQEVLLRLADALAGFIRDYLEAKRYATAIISKEKFARFFRKI